MARNKWQTQKEKKLVDFSGLGGGYQGPSALVG